MPFIHNPKGLYLSGINLVKKLRKISKGGQNGESMPDLGNYASDEVIPVRFGKRFRIDDRYTYLWDGKPEDYYTD